ncbi:hypothetical protein AQJ66_31725 [Streptomyces bungoensis]|uniref:ATP-grasp domain-containing protein n=1 Tax=Streptomyces bungoensis TaxID=285568 RepID=A0A101SQW7_9ACTN|nr:hypothetical protein [Streptomyces bungoensis]KUN78302.1 hypothetical protein AQJ66_31725 [Streptomyces bungoensis]
MKEDIDVRRIFLLNPDQRLLEEAAHSGVQVRSAQVDAMDESALRIPLAEAAAAGLYVNPARALWTLADPAAVQRLVRDNRLAPCGIEAAPGDPRLTVETLSVHGMHQAVGITARTPYGLLHPAPLTDDAAAEVRAVVTALLDLTGYQYGPAHTSVALTARGPVITGCRAGLGDDPVPELVRAAGGCDLAAGAVAVLAGRLVEPARPHRFAAAVVLEAPWKPGSAEVGGLPGVLHVVAPEPPRPGHVVIEVDSPETAERQVADLRALVLGEDG